MRPYTENFYKKHQDGSRRSAREIVPLVLELIQPNCVIDVGCGVGTWLSVFRQYGVEEVFGVDGEWVDREMLEISKEQFMSVDLTKPLRLDRQFDLVISVEVAEHLPSSCSGIFIDSLTRLGPVILFSAAIPYQGGTQHVNEQWPDYWVKHFHEQEYAVIDCLRKKIWQNDNVEWPYVQNILIFVRKDYLGHQPLLNREFENTTPSHLSMVHPRNYIETIGLMRWLHLTAQDLAALISPGDAFILVDDAYIQALQEQFKVEIAVGRQAIPFLERDGQYWGPPPDDITAVQELERLRRSGANFIVFAWSAFWWLDYYSGLHHHLQSQFRCVLEHERLVVFELRQ
jgi:SAM-dependent methyltransferase